MKRKFVSVAPVKTNRAEFDIICLRDAKKIFDFSEATGIVHLIGESQPDVTLDCFTNLINGNFRIAFR